MTSINPFEMTDLFNLQNVNLDYLTENFPVEFYLEYLILWPTLFFQNSETLNTIPPIACQSLSSLQHSATTHPKHPISGYIMGKTEGKNLEWHSHITAVTVSKLYRRISLASQYLCVPFQMLSDSLNKVEFVDLFVKCNNQLAVNMYEKMGYSVFRRVVGYYNNSNDINTASANLKNLKNNDEKDAFDMRLSMPRNDNKSIRKDGKNHRCLPQDVKF